MRGLKALVIVLGVVILAMMATIAVTLVHRSREATTTGPEVAVSSLILDEPAGTHILSIAPAGPRLAVLLQGGGPDRVFLIDPVSGRVVGRVLLRR